MNPGYHVHAYFAVYNQGKFFHFDGTDIGRYYAKDCLFELHTHPQYSGNVIHIETGTPLYPTLSTYLKIMKLTVGSSKTPNLNPSGVQREVWVNGKRYYGDPLNIKLTKHEQIVVELGAPFFKPKPFKFPQGL